MLLGFPVSEIQLDSFGVGELWDSASADVVSVHPAETVQIWVIIKYTRQGVLVAVNVLYAVVKKKKKKKKKIKKKKEKKSRMSFFMEKSDTQKLQTECSSLSRNLPVLSSSAATIWT